MWLWCLLESVWPGGGGGGASVLVFCQRQNHQSITFTEVRKTPE